MTSDAERRVLLMLARRAIAAAVGGSELPAIVEGALASRPGGAFVTILKHGRLRGCIGHIEPDEPLPGVVVRCAVAACREDPRFRAVDASELADLEIELSLMGPLEEIAGPDEIEIGRHGLVVEQGRHRGLLLPQVAIEWRWDARTLLAQTCRKAGLPRDGWRQARLWRFEAEVFGERDL
jgi:AmmeMemoRadiSam system protein A